MFAWHTGLRTRITAYVSANSYVRMQVYGIALYTHGRTQPSGRGSNLVYMHHIRQERTQERGLQVRPAIRKAQGGGGCCTLQALYPPLYGILTQW